MMRLVSQINHTLYCASFSIKTQYNLSTNRKLSQIWRFHTNPSIN